MLLGFTRALRASGVPVTHDRSTGFLEAASDRRSRRPAGDLLGRAGHALRRAGRPGPLRPGLRGLLQRAGRAAPAASGDPHGVHGARARGVGERGRPGRPRRRRGAPGGRQRGRGAPPPRRGGDERGRQATARPDVRDPPAAAAHASYRPAPGLAPRRPRRLPDPAREPAPDGGAGRDRLATTRRPTAPGGAPGRRVRLDERLRRRAAPARAPLHGLHRRDPRRRGRDVHRRHPAHPRHPGDAAARRRPGHRRGRRDRARLVRAAPASARRCGSSWTGGASAGWPAARSW